MQSRDCRPTGNDLYCGLCIYGARKHMHASSDPSSFLGWPRCTFNVRLGKCIKKIMHHSFIAAIARITSCQVGNRYLNIDVDAIAVTAMGIALHRCIHGYKNLHYSLQVQV